MKSHFRLSAFVSAPINWNLQGCAAPYLPPGGRCPSAHTGADEERRYVPYLYALREKGTLEKSVPFKLTALQMVRCRHSSSTASRSPFPPGEGIVRHSSLQTPICRTLGDASQHISKSSPKGIPQLSYISYLRPYALNALSVFLFSFSLCILFDVGAKMGYSIRWRRALCLCFDSLRAFPRLRGS